MAVLATRFGVVFASRKGGVDQNESIVSRLTIMTATKQRSAAFYANGRS
jgi:hypothetical protein